MRKCKVSDWLEFCQKESHFLKETLMRQLLKLPKRIKWSIVTQCLDKSDVRLELEVSVFS